MISTRPRRVQALWADAATRSPARPLAARVRVAEQDRAETAGEHVGALDQRPNELPSTTVSGVLSPEPARTEAMPSSWASCCAAS